MAGLGNSPADITPSAEEGDVEEVVGGAVISAKKWTIEEDERLIRAWINIGTDAVVGADQKKVGFWGRVASNFNEHRPLGASTRTWKTLNGRWSRCSPLVSKWVGIMLEVERSNHSGWNESMMLNEAHRLYTERMGKKFDLEHWYALLKDQPKWRPTCLPPTSESGSSKRSNPDTEEAGDEGAGGSERPEGRKAAKRRLKQKANSDVVDAITAQMKDLNETFKSFITVAKEEKYQKMMLRAEKKRDKEDKILMTDTSTMPPEHAAYYERKKAEIIRNRSEQSTSTP